MKLGDPNHLNRPPLADQNSEKQELDKYKYQMLGAFLNLLALDPGEARKALEIATKNLNRDLDHDEIQALIGSYTNRLPKDNTENQTLTQTSKSDLPYLPASLALAGEVAQTRAAELVELQNILNNSEIKDRIGFKEFYKQLITPLLQAMCKTGRVMVTPLRAGTAIKFSVASESNSNLPIVEIELDVMMGGGVWKEIDKQDANLILEGANTNSSDSISFGTSSVANKLSEILLMDRSTFLIPSPKDLKGDSYDFTKGSFEIPESKFLSGKVYNYEYFETEGYFGRKKIALIYNEDGVCGFIDFISARDGSVGMLSQIFSEMKIELSAKAYGDGHSSIGKTLQV